MYEHGKLGISYLAYIGNQHIVMIGRYVDSPKGLRFSAFDDFFLIAVKSVPNSQAIKFTF